MHHAESVECFAAYIIVISYVPVTEYCLSPSSRVLNRVLVLIDKHVPVSHSIKILDRFRKRACHTESDEHSC